MHLFKISLLNDQKSSRRKLELRREERQESPLQRFDENLGHVILMEMMLLLVAKCSSDTT